MSDLGRRRAPPRFDALHRNTLWQLDFTELRVGAEQRWLLVIEDDFSRFVVGHVLADGLTIEARGRRIARAGIEKGRSSRGKQITARRSY